MNTEIKEPLYKRLNKKIEELRFIIASTPHEDRRKGVRFHVNVNAHEELSNEYKDLAVNNLNILAEALEAILNCAFTNSSNTVEIGKSELRKAKEALNKIS